MCVWCGVCEVCVHVCVLCVFVPMPTYTHSISYIEAIFVYIVFYSITCYVRITCKYVFNMYACDDM